MTKCYCDKCGKKLEDKYRQVASYWTKGGTNEYFDLCEECYSGFKEWLMEKAEAEE